MPIGEIATATAAAVPAINSALTLIDRVSKLVKGGATLEAQEAVLALRESLLAVKEENLSLKHDNLGLREELGTLRKSLENKNQIKFEYPNYYQFSEDGDKDGPFCKSCKDKDDKLVRLTVSKPDAAWHCDVCKNNFETEAQRRTIHSAMNRNNSSGPHDWMRR